MTILKKKCFIIASINFNLNEIKTFFSENYYISSFDIRDINAFSNTIGTLRHKISKVDFVCAIILGEKSPNLYFELGIAVSLRKPIFLITDNISDIPYSSISSLSIVNIDSFDIERIKYVFSIFYKKKVINKTKPKILIKEPKNIEKSNKILSNIKGKNFEDKIKSILELDQTLTITSGALNQPFDLIIWSDSLNNYFTNPIPIDLKININQKNLLEISERFKNYLIEKRLNLGIIIYEGNIIDFKESPNFPLIFVFHVKDIENELELNKPFSKLLIEKRNKIIHGGYTFD